MGLPDLSAQNYTGKATRANGLDYQGYDVLEYLAETWKLQEMRGQTWKCARLKGVVVTKYPGVPTYLETTKQGKASISSANQTV